MQGNEVLFVTAFHQSAEVGMTVRFQNNNGQTVEGVIISCGRKTCEVQEALEDETCRRRYSEVHPVLVAPGE